MKYSLGFIKLNGKNVLIEKHRGLFLNKLNAIGGCIENGENPLDNWIKEVEEETGLLLSKSLDDIKFEGIMKFQLDNKPYDVLYLFSVKLENTIQEVTSSDEGPIHLLTDEEMGMWNNRDRLAPITFNLFYNMFRNETWSYRVMTDNINEVKIFEMIKGNVNINENN